MIEEFDGEQEIEQVIQDFIDRGLIEIFGVDSITGEFTYKLTEKCKKEYPELFEEHNSFINQLAFGLWEKGYIEMKFADDGTPMAMLKPLNYKDDIFPNISQEERHFIENMQYLESKKGDII